MTAAIKTALIHSKKPEITDAIRRELKAFKIENVITPSTDDQCIAELQGYPEALLVLDWGVGAGEAIKILEATRNPIKLGIRPIFLFSAEDIKGLSGVAAEYSVLQMHVGEISQELIKQKLQEISKSEAFPLEVRDELVKVSNARQQNNWQEAENLLQQLYQKHPEIERIGVELAENMVHLGKIDQAIAVLEPMVERESPDVRTLNTYGRCLMNKKEFEKATVYLQRAKLLNPFRVERLIELGTAYLELDNPKRAKLNFEDALKLDPDNESAISGVGQSLLLTGEINEALRFLKELSGPSEMASVFNSSAIIAMRGGRFKEGMELYKVAVKTIGNHPLILSKIAFNMGIGFWRFKDLPNAFLSFHYAKHLDPSYTKAIDKINQLAAKITPPAFSPGSDVVGDLMNLSQNSKLTKQPSVKGSDAGSGGDYDINFADNEGDDKDDDVALVI